MDQFIIRDGLFTDAQVVTRTVPGRRPDVRDEAVSRTPGVDPVVVRTRIAHADTSRYLLLPVRSAERPRGHAHPAAALRLPAGPLMPGHPPRVTGPPRVTAPPGE